MVASAIHRRLKKEGFENFVFRTSDELDLRDQQAVADFFAKEKLVMFFLLLQKWVAFLRTILTVQNFCMITL